MNLPNSEWFTNGSCMYIQRQFVSWHITSTIFLQLWTVLCIFENVCFHRNQKATFVVVAISGKAPTPQPLAPQVTFEGDYSGGIERLATLLVNHYGSDLFPVVSVGDDLDRPVFGGELKTSIPGRHPAQDLGLKCWKKKQHVCRLKTLQIKQIILNITYIYINKKIWHSTTSRCYFYQMLTDYVLPLCHGNHLIGSDKPGETGDSLGYGGNLSW